MKTCYKSLRLIVSLMVTMLLSACGTPNIATTATVVLNTATLIPPTNTPRLPTFTPKPTATVPPPTPTCTPFPVAVEATDAPAIASASEDFVFQIQSGKDGKPQAYGGITSEAGSSNVQIGGGKKNAGFWKSESAKIYRVAFYDETTRKLFALIDLRGIVRWSKNGDLVEGEENFLKMELAGKQGVYQKIITWEATNGGLNITIENGAAFFLSNFSYDFSGLIRPQQC